MSQDCSCYEDLLADPSLVSTFPVDEWSFVNELPCLSALCFRVVVEGAFAKLVTPEVWGQAGINFTTHSSKRVRSEEIAPMAILITDGVGEGKLRMATVFCWSDQAKVDPSVVLLNLIQCDLHEPAMVVVKIFTNSSYFLWGSFGLSFLDIASTVWFSLSWLHLHQLLLYSQPGPPAQGEGGNEVVVIPITEEALLESFIKEYCLSSLVLLSLLPLVPATSLSNHEDRGL